MSIDIDKFLKLFGNKFALLSNGGNNHINLKTCCGIKYNKRYEASYSLNGLKHQQKQLLSQAHSREAEQGILSWKKKSQMQRDPTLAASKDHCEIGGEGPIRLGLHNKRRKIARSGHPDLWTGR